MKMPYTALRLAAFWFALATQATAFGFNVMVYMQQHNAANLALAIGAPVVMFAVILINEKGDLHIERFRTDLHVAKLLAARIEAAIAAKDDDALHAAIDDHTTH